MGVGVTVGGATGCGLALQGALDFCFLRFGVAAARPSAPADFVAVDSVATDCGEI